MHQHDHYEELCALAVSGQISAEDSTDLAEHTTACTSCRNLLDDFAQIAAQALPQVSEKHNPVKIPPGMTQRFVARARSEGIPLRRTPPRTATHRWSWPRVFAWQTAAAAILVIVPSVIWFRSHSQRPIVTLDARDSGRVSEQQLVRDSIALRVQVADLQSRINGLNRAIVFDKQVLRSAESNTDRLSARMADLEKENGLLHRDLTDRDAQAVENAAQAAQTTASLAKLSSEKATDELLLQADQSELVSLRAKVASLVDELNESQELSAAANQAKDLIVARNLHIVDVDDTDATGRRQRPFGRIFYTEGKNLVFYAYDLSDPRKLNAKINFYVWGSQEGVNKPVQSLGIFHSDDPKDGRWVLKFDDPRILAEINCVFVTAESARKDIKQPTGQQILFASLGSTNHP